MDPEVQTPDEALATATPSTAAPKTSNGHKDVPESASASATDAKETVVDEGAVPATSTSDGETKARVLTTADVIEDLDDEPEPPPGLIGKLRNALLAPIILLFKTAWRLVPRWVKNSCSLPRSSRP